MVKNSSKTKKKNTKNNATSKKEKKQVTVVEEEISENLSEQEDFLDEKIEKKSLAKRIFDIVFWIVIIFLFIVWIVDFARVKNEKEPKFCLVNKEYKDEAKTGTIQECIGLGYKVYKHDSEDNTSIQFKSIFSKYSEK